MSSTDFVYGKGRKAIGQGQIDLLTAAVNIMLVSADYTPAPTIDQWVSDVTASAIILRDVALTGLGLSSSGVFFGTIPPFNALSSAIPVVAVILYVKDSVDSSSALLYYSSTGPGFPFTPQGFNYVIGFDQANGGYFQA